MRLFDGQRRDFDALHRAFRWQLPRHFNIGAAITAPSPDRDERLALLTEDAQGRIGRMRFAELRSAAARCANALRALGIGPGERVAIILAQRIETAVAHLACYQLGAIAVPLSVLFGADALRYRLADSAARVVITAGAAVHTVRAMAAELPALAEVIDCDDPGPRGYARLLSRASDVLQPLATLADDPALLIYTSGTTGPPKGALGAHRCLLGNLPGFELSQNFFPEPGDLFWTPADWAWTGGLLDALLPSLYYGVPVLGHDGGRFDPERACDLLRRHGVRNAFIPPTALKMLRQVPDIRARFTPRLRAIMSAGEQLGEEVLRWTTEDLGVPVNEMWGQTEFNYLVGNCQAIMPVRPGSMGKPYPGHTVAVLDDEGQPLPPGEVGELAAHCDDPVMFLGYWGRPQARAEKQRGAYFCTGDLGYRDEDGYLWFTGRKDDVINSAGYRIGPGEVEDSLLTHPAVAQAAAVASPDALRGNIVKAFIVLAAGHAPSDALVRDIQHSVRTRLAAYEYPREIEFVNELPMTTSGKVRRVELRQREIERKRLTRPA